MEQKDNNMEIATSTSQKVSTKTKILVGITMFLAGASIFAFAGLALDEIKNFLKPEQKIVVQNTIIKQDIKEEATDSYKYLCDDNLDKLMVIYPNKEMECLTVEELTKKENLGEIFTNPEITKIPPTYGLSEKIDPIKYNQAQKNFWIPFEKKFNFSIVGITDSMELKIDCPENSILKVVGPDQEKTCYTEEELIYNPEIKKLLINPEYEKIIAPSANLRIEGGGSGSISFNDIITGVKKAWNWFIEKTGL